MRPPFQSVECTIANIPGFFKMTDDKNRDYVKFNGSQLKRGACVPHQIRHTVPHPSGPPPLQPCGLTLPPKFGAWHNIINLRPKDTKYAILNRGNYGKAGGDTAV
jgi:hypothetical protein